MKKTSKPKPAPADSDELSPDYDFDYAKAKPNRFATRTKPASIPINLCELSAFACHKKPLTLPPLC